MQRDGQQKSPRRPWAQCCSCASKIAGPTRRLLRAQAVTPLENAQGPSIDAFVEALAAVREPIGTATNDGQATGIAMKHLKANEVSASGKDVSEAERKVFA